MGAPYGNCNACKSGSHGRKRQNIKGIRKYGTIGIQLGYTKKDLKHGINFNRKLLRKTLPTNYAGRKFLQENIKRDLYWLKHAK